MDNTISTIAYIIFFALLGIFATVSLLSIYIYIRYGRSFSITLASSGVFAALFVIGSLAAFVSLQNFLTQYAR